MAEGQGAHTRSLTRLGSVTTVSLLTQSVSFAQNVALLFELKLSTAHGAHSRSVDFVGGTLTKKPGSHWLSSAQLSPSS
jgi:hypothetical protein